MAGGIGGLSSSGPRGRRPPVAEAAVVDPSTVSRGGHAIRGAGHAIRELPEAERPRERLALRGPAG